MQQTTASLIRLGDTDLAVADPAEDIRGRKAVDLNGEEIGKVQSLLIDDAQSKVRFLAVESGAFLGLGGETRLVPVDAVTEVGDDAVTIDQTRERVHESPEYDPQLAREVDLYSDVYGFYGYSPFWMPGYAYPAYPYYGRHGRR